MDQYKVIYEAKEINKRFPGVHALKDVNFSLRAGEIHGLVGHNGAGKSTLVKVLTGNYLAESGELYLNGEKITLSKPKDAIDHHISIVTQEGTLIPNFTGIQNIFLGKEICKAGIVQDKKLEEKAKELVAKTELDFVDLDVPVEELSYAQRKIIEILKIINQDPKIVIFDESTASLSDKERKLLFEVTRKFRNSGVGVIFITHYLDEVLEICDRITVMRDGQNVGTVLTADIKKEDIVRLMINKDQKSEFPNYERNFGDKLIEIEHFSDGDLVKDVSMYVRRGEVVGLFGTVGSGRTEFGEMIFGVRKTRSGTLRLNGKEIKIKHVRDAIRAGIVLIPDERLEKALMVEEAVVDNITLPYLSEYVTSGIVNRKSELEDSDKIVNKLSIRTPTLLTKVKSLSGGNKQKLSFGKWVTGVKGKAEFYIFDEPTEGVDVGACAEMYRIIADLVQKGSGCLIISSDLSEIIGLSDRIYVMKDGIIVGEVERNMEDVHSKIISYSLGV